MSWKNLKQTSLADDTLLQIRDFILKRAYRNIPLSKVVKQIYHIHSATRSIVERVFGVMKLHYDMGRARYLGLVRNQAHFMLMTFVYNLKGHLPSTPNVIYQPNKR